MGKPKVKIKNKTAKKKGAVKINFKAEPYIGDPIRLLKMQNEELKRQNDSLRRQNDSLKIVISTKGK